MDGRGLGRLVWMQCNERTVQQQQAALTIRAAESLWCVQSKSLSSIGREMLTF